MKEIFIYVLVGISSLIMMSYAVHMFVGGLVSAETEEILTIVVCSVVSAVMGYMVADVVHQRRGK